MTTTKSACLLLLCFCVAQSYAAAPAQQATDVYDMETGQKVGATSSYFMTGDEFRASRQGKGASQPSARTMGAEEGAKESPSALMERVSGKDIRRSQ